MQFFLWTFRCLRRSHLATGRLNAGGVGGAAAMLPMQATFWAGKPQTQRLTSSVVIQTTITACLQMNVQTDGPQFDGQQTVTAIWQTKEREPEPERGRQR